jgi:tricorn protease
VENKGVAPDHEVEFDPAAWRRGEDPQLQAGVDLLMKELRDHPPQKGKRPPYPNYHQPPAKAGGGR